VISVCIVASIGLGVSAASSGRVHRVALGCIAWVGSGSLMLGELVFVAVEAVLAGEPAALLVPGGGLGLDRLGAEARGAAPGGGLFIATDPLDSGGGSC